jgi:hypothetical protein
MSKKLRGGIVGTLFALAILAGVHACGGVTDDRVAAREKAVNAICDRYAFCKLIGTDLGDAYPTRDSCLIAWRANREEAWPAASCQGKIYEPELNVCLGAITGTACEGFDFVATLGKCAAATVCSAGNRPDGG